jgi:Circularly permuted ATP-grasp type 2
LSTGTRYLDTRMPTPQSAWHDLLRPEVELSEHFWRELAGELRDARLTFGERPLCPFLRPFFVDEADEIRVRQVAEAMAAMGERVVKAATVSPSLLDQLRLTDEEAALVRIDPGYERASTASRLDAFLLPDSLKFAEYNAESPAGLGYAENLAEIFEGLDVMRAFECGWRTRYYKLSNAILDALIESYREWGGRANPPTILITDFRGVPTWSEFEILQQRFEARGVPTVVADPRELEFDGSTLIAGGRPVDLVYRRVLVSDIVARRDDSHVLLRAYESGRVCVANTFRCKIPHKKAFFAVLTDPQNAALFSAEEQAVIRNHVPWTRVLADVQSDRDGEPVDLLPFVRRERERLVIKPNDEYGGTGVVLGWEASEAEWDAAIGRAVGAGGGAWVAQERIPVRREPFPVVEEPHRVTMRDMLVDFAPYLFRGRQIGFLTRLSGSGLANVTSGGGQVPSFVVAPR